MKAIASSREQHRKMALTPLPAWIERAQGKLVSARILLDHEQHDDVAELCLFAVEMILKACIARHFTLPSVPGTGLEWEQYTGKNYFTHNLDILLKASQKGDLIRLDYLAEWSIITQWAIDERYKPVGTVSRRAAEEGIEAAATLLEALWT
jgi:HEPN domain-containing protein